MKKRREKHLLDITNCLYCGEEIPIETFPHFCKDCLTIMKNGGTPQSVQVQSEIVEGETIWE